MSINKPKSPLVTIINLSDNKEYNVYPIDAIEIVRLGHGVYKDINDAPKKIQRELALIDSRIAQATKAVSESTPAPKKEVVAKEPKETVTDLDEDNLEDNNEDTPESAETQTRRMRRRATAV